MNDRMDRELRELFEELDQAAPEPPPPPRVPERRPTPLWQRALVPLGAAAALLLVFGVVGQLLSGDSEGATDTTSAGDATETTEAMDAADTTADDGPEVTRPPGTALILADLNLACTLFVDNSALAVPASPVSEEDHRDALVSLLTPVEELNTSVLTAESELNDPSFDPIAEEASLLVDLVEGAAGEPVSEAPSVYRQTRLDIDSLGNDLAAYGALDCSELAANIP